MLRYWIASIDHRIYQVHRSSLMTSVMTELLVIEGVSWSSEVLPKQNIVYLTHSIQVFTISLILSIQWYTGNICFLPFVSYHLFLTICFLPFVFYKFCHLTICFLPCPISYTICFLPFVILYHVLFAWAWFLPPLRFWQLLLTRTLVDPVSTVYLFNIS